ncbi:uncharacterized protein LOC9645404 [Selaginella moellendorffii]|uniref:uncharacterized protein LOC9645404 n=1 Tax=Selaginella moellendorffii TaxID=88036 RepID=UPI000D1C2DDC|nr:uncharacterized protein LOC9645404 [Selaginella moellendorffii]|eukprot:XP_024522237.1 uncharacterized protein LOC9645404 [Selaginella moellendorffii]
MAIFFELCKMAMTAVKVCYNLVPLLFAALAPSTRASIQALAMAFVSKIVSLGAMAATACHNLVPFLCGLAASFTNISALAPSTSIAMASIQAVAMACVSKILSLAAIAATACHNLVPFLYDSAASSTKISAWAPTIAMAATSIQALAMACFSPIACYARTTSGSELNLRVLWRWAIGLVFAFTRSVSVWPLILIIVFYVAFEIVSAVEWIFGPVFQLIQYVLIKIGLPCPLIITGKRILVFPCDDHPHSLVGIMGEQRPAIILQMAANYVLTNYSWPWKIWRVDLFVYVSSDELLRDHDKLMQEARHAYREAVRQIGPVEAFVIAGKKSQVTRSRGIGPAFFLMTRRLKNELAALGYEYRLYCFKTLAPAGFLDAPPPAPIAPSQALRPRRPDPYAGASDAYNLRNAV